MHRQAVGAWYKKKNSPSAQSLGLRQRLNPIHAIPCTQFSPGDVVIFHRGGTGIERKAYSRLLGRASGELQIAGALVLWQLAWQLQRVSLAVLLAVSLCVGSCIQDKSCQ